MSASEGGFEFVILLFVIVWGSIIVEFIYNRGKKAGRENPDDNDNANL